ncbi:hypothetical protein L218DRAFT_839483, partial [Marasmius fiardii PR-910]
PDACVGSTEKPNIKESWDVIMKTVDALDEDQVKGYKEDIDTLLVFAGLFSAVVTAFTLYNQSVNLNQTLAPPSSHFIPDSSSVRINIYWFLSLSLALVDALFGLLCKQWVREHQRQTSTDTPDQALALCWLRYRSFQKWHVSAILASLPIFLEMALFLFFAGLLELLWPRHPPIFFIVLAVVGLALIFYLATTILPGLTIIHGVSPSVSYLSGLDLVCPYKSPQSWLAFRVFSAIYKGAARVLELHNMDAVRALMLRQTHILHLSDWPSLDLNIIQRFSSFERCPDPYQLKGLRWLVQETRNMPAMRPHLKNVLEQLPLHLIMPTVFDRWHLPS